jgi:hypothetical protein
MKPELGHHLYVVIFTAATRLLLFATAGARQVNQAQSLVRHSFEGVEHNLKDDLEMHRTGPSSSLIVLV